MNSHIQFFVWHRSRKILRGPYMVINQPRWLSDAHDRETRDCYPEGDPLRGDPGWVSGTLEKILRTPGVDRIEIAQALGVRKP